MYASCLSIISIERKHKKGYVFVVANNVNGMYPIHIDTTRPIHCCPRYYPKTFFEYSPCFTGYRKFTPFFVLPREETASIQDVVCNGINFLL